MPGEEEDFDGLQMVLVVLLGEAMALVLGEKRPRPPPRRSPGPTRLRRCSHRQPLPSRPSLDASVLAVEYQVVIGAISSFEAVFYKA
jgi:hypothetical protein